MNLLIEFAHFHDRRRNAELLLTLHENLSNDSIVGVHIFLEASVSLKFATQKIHTIAKEHRATYLEFFQYCNERLEGQICVVANSDIIFDQTLQIVNQLDLTSRFLALSRWEIDYQGSSFQYRHFNNSASQDVWIFRSPIPVSDAMDFPLGIPGCDNRIARIVSDLGYHVSNPSKRIFAKHFHSVETRLPTRNKRVPGPYLLVPTTDQLEDPPDNFEITGFDALGNPENPSTCPARILVVDPSISKSSIEIIDVRHPHFDVRVRPKMKMLTCFSESHSGLFERMKASLCSTNPGIELSAFELTQVSPSGQYGASGFRETMVAKLDAILLAIEEVAENDRLIYTDADVQFFGDVEADILASDYPDVDILFQDDVCGNCAGFMVMRKNQRIRAFIEKARSLTRNHPEYDQGAINDLIRDGFEISTARLPQNKYFTVASAIGCKLWQGESFEVPSEILFHHANWAIGTAQKIDLMNYVHSSVSDTNPKSGSVVE